MGTLNLGYVPHDNIHEINTPSVPFKHSVVRELCAEYSLGGVNMGDELNLAPAHEEALG